MMIRALKEGRSRKFSSVVFSFHVEVILPTSHFVFVVCRSGQLLTRAHVILLVK